MIREIKLFAILGCLINHSFTPKMHNRWFKEEKLNCIYLAFEPSIKHFKKVLLSLKFLGFSGFNITLPYKIEVINYLKVKFNDYLFFTNCDSRFGDIAYKTKKSSTNVAVIDLSILLDGRIYEVINTKFLNFDLIIPSFVIVKLKNIVKSSNHVERSIAKRSLAILDVLEKLNSVNVSILKTSLSNEKDNISKIIDIAKSKKAQIITKDFEVYKIASLEKITVLNFNDLEASLYPVFIPGQKLYINLVKEGAQHDQAIGYFDEKTTIVVQDAKGYIGKNVQVVITSSIFTSNGKLVFGRIVKEIK